MRKANCKVIISRPIKRHDYDNASCVVGEVIAQFQKLTIDMIGNENIEKKQGKRFGSLWFWFEQICSEFNS